MAMSWNKRPEMALDTTKTYHATLKLAHGDIRIQLFAADAPETVNSFVFLSKQGYYDGVTFHRVIAGFMAQGGDPNGTGTGGPGYYVPDEVNQNKHGDEGGVAMAKTNAPNSAGSQFYITIAPTPFLDKDYTVFGRVVEGMDVVKKIRLRDPDRDRTPGDAITTIEIQES